MSPLLCWLLTDLMSDNGVQRGSRDPHLENDLRAAAFTYAVTVPDASNPRSLRVRVRLRYNYVCVDLVTPARRSKPELATEVSTLSQARRGW